MTINISLEDDDSKLEKKEKTKTKYYPLDEIIVSMIDNTNNGTVEYDEINYIIEQILLRLFQDYNIDELEEGDIENFVNNILPTFNQDDQNIINKLIEIYEPGYSMTFDYFDDPDEQLEYQEKYLSLEQRCKDSINMIDTSIKTGTLKASKYLAKIFIDGITESLDTVQDWIVQDGDIE